ncbi:hypothetical protein FRACYDRAFT_245032 [Fragilariopsis cylindrus CCMP1102]|uniref:BTB domain-containing protein n=1 Tax=Fragilariopsis cylindrus CCMP1102 TaxID=635003 RepID=A0A1E7F1B7_9STRA|nr:hypothetical protein FRACYDRAFT_245032 [Fragilariopsis cylindrus CCMP1102]|eukprot:OEU11909.1 hypothetical protein FRACYDRAFT_245032 [Fragilariopsis cylindrus CCMP1102]
MGDNIKNITNANNNIFLNLSYVDLTTASSTDEDENENERQPASKRRRNNFRNAGPYWSKHPEDEARYTDWKLIVYYKHFARGDTNDDEEPNNKDDDQKNSKAVYSVHRNMLGTKCDYFDRMFQSNFSESKSGETKLDLPDCDAVVTLQDFENLLDWFYTEDQIEFDPANVVGMLYLSDYFCIESLKVQAQTYTQKHLHSMSSHYEHGPDTKILVVYYRNAKMTNNEYLQNLVAHVCCLNPETMCMDSELTTNLQDIDLWISIFRAIPYLEETHDMTTAQNDAIWSVHFAHFCDQYPHQVDTTNFRILTSKESLPKISEDAAVRLLEHEQRLGLANPSAVVQHNNSINSSEGQLNYDGFHGARKVGVVPSVGQHQLLKDHHQDSATRTLTCLQQRCLDALYDTETGLWNIRKPELVLGRLKNLSGFVFESIMLNSISNNSITQKDPTSIIVKGAELCNGIYRLSGYDAEIGAYIFHKHSTYLGESDRRIFRLSKQQRTEDKDVFNWFISVLPARSDRRNTTAAKKSSEIDLYLASTSASKRSKLPPNNGWKIPKDPAPGASDQNRVPILSYSKTEMMGAIRALDI